MKSIRACLPGFEPSNFINADAVTSVSKNKLREFITR